ncbi:MAG TPA: sulfotransferase domain-containing protein [Roseiflexaceae bacterium]|nr:sulfotransferase domain-containing protein [Roseiflexaceae bacterium]
MLIFCCGMYRSCSTWQYLVASEILESHGLGKRAGFLHTQQDVQNVVNRLDDTDEHLVLKLHSFDPTCAELIRAGKAIALYSYRDIRDVAVSMAYKVSAPLAELVRNGIIEDAVQSFYRWTSLPGTLVQQYEAIVASPAEAVYQIAKHLHIELTASQVAAIVEHNSIETNTSRTQRLKEQLEQDGVNLDDPQNALRFDDHTLLHWNHIRPQAHNDWRSQLSMEELLLLFPLIGTWLKDTGIERDPTWILQPLLRDQPPEVQREVRAILGS